MLSKGTIGGRKCEVQLQKILEEHADKRLIRKVTDLLLDFKFGLKQISYMPDLGFKRRFYVDWYHSACKKVADLHFAEDVKTHTLCCLKAYYRDLALLVKKS